MLVAEAHGSQTLRGSPDWGAMETKGLLNGFWQALIKPRTGEGKSVYRNKKHWIYAAKLGAWA